MREDGVGNFKLLESRQIENIPVFLLYLTIYKYIQYFIEYKIKILWGNSIKSVLCKNMHLPRMREEEEWAMREGVIRRGDWGLNLTRQREEEEAIREGVMKRGDWGLTVRGSC